MERVATAIDVDAGELIQLAPAVEVAHGRRPGALECGLPDSSEPRARVPRSRGRRSRERVGAGDRSAPDRRASSPG